MATTMGPTPPAAFLIDGTAFCYRAFYAIRSLSTSDGRPTNAVYGFARMLQALRDKEHPAYLAVAFDVGKPTFRHQKFEEYKGQRKPMPDDLIAQLPLIKQLLAAYRIPVFEQAGYEAEDVLATIARQITTQDVSVYLVTGDKDALQLVNSHVKVYNPHHDKEAPVLDAAAVKARYGLGPESMVDLMALMGDAVDNIPSVPGIGEKTAVQLLQRFGTLERLYAHLDEVEQPARRQALANHREQVQLSRELAQIDANVPVQVSLEQLKIHEPDWRALRQVFRESEFKRLLESIEAEGNDGMAQASSVSVIEDLREAGQVLAKTTTPIAVACWPIGNAGEAVVMAAAVDVHRACVVTVDANILKREEGKTFTEWLSNAHAPKICHDGKRVKRLLRNVVLALNGLAGDTMIAAYLLNPSRTSQTLTDLADEYLDICLGPVPVIDGPLSLASSDVTRACASAACAIVRLHEALRPKLQEHGLAALYQDLELPLVEVLAEMEATGIALDLEYVAILKARMDAQLHRLTEDLHRLAGSTFNLNSPKQLAHVLFDDLKLPVVKRTKTGPSTDSEVLQQLASKHPFPQQLMEYRELSKLIFTYVDALPKLVNPVTGRIHASFNQTATATGRLSASDPNLQHIPIKTELGRQIRKAFIPGERGWVLLALDYSQIELRILAHLSHDPTLTDAFRQERDIHRYTASLIHGVPESDVTSEMRNAMKAINYGILYGMSAHGLAKGLGMTYEEAAAFIQAYFDRYSAVRAFLDAQIEQAKQTGYVQTLLGRRRYIPEVKSPDLATRQFGERMAVNAPIQGTAADLVKQAMVQMAGQLRQRRVSSRMILQVHDELVFECPQAEAETIGSLAREVMEHAIELSVPLRVTIKQGPNWLEMTPRSA